MYHDYIFISRSFHPQLVELPYGVSLSLQILKKHKIYCNHTCYFPFWVFLFFSALIFHRNNSDCVQVGSRAGRLHWLVVIFCKVTMFRLLVPLLLPYLDLFASPFRKGWSIGMWRTWDHSWLWLAKSYGGDSHQNWTPLYGVLDHHLTDSCRPSTQNALPLHILCRLSSFISGSVPAESCASCTTGIGHL